ILIASAMPLAVTGCATPQRLPAVPRAEIPQAQTGLGQIRYLVARETATFAADAQAVMQREEAWLKSQGRSEELPPAYFLAISGGGDNGAFGAGLLNGWTGSRNRPEVKLVTGVIRG